MNLWLFSAASVRLIVPDFERKLLAFKKVITSHKYQVLDARTICNKAAN
jgi:hypothetical protein